MMKTPNFWEFTVGNVCTVVSVIISCAALYFTFRKYHKENRETIAREIQERAEDRQKLDKVYCWIENNSEDFMEMKASVKFVSDWIRMMWQSKSGAD